MCKFFSCISNGKGKTLFFTPTQIITEMVKGNPNEYNWNSHTSIASFNGIIGVSEDRWNKWEYNIEDKVLRIDNLNVVDDNDKVKKVVDRFLEGKDVLFLQNLYNRNSGYLNSGDQNSGNRNRGYRNSGDLNSGDRNSGNLNSGDRNSGNLNSGYQNSGDRNSGYRNSGYQNSGDRNSGDRNSGNLNSGNLNSGNGFLNSFCSKQSFFIFNKEVTETQYNEIYDLDFSWFDLTLWISEITMTDKEKKENPSFFVASGYLKTISYKEAWKNCPKEVLDQIKQLPNFNASIFEEISGIKV
jgi:hypothetical protein